MARSFVVLLALLGTACGEAARTGATAGPTSGAEGAPPEATAEPRAEPVAQAEPVAHAEPQAGAEQVARCELSPVYFAYDSTSLDAAARAVIDRDMECVRAQGLERVVLTGFTDDEGTAEYAMHEAERYALAVRARLVELGFDRAHITIRSMGEEAAVGTDAESRARDRRVELSAE